MSFLDSKVAEGENAQSKRQQVQNGDRDTKLLLFLANSWAQVRNQCFTAKAVYTFTCPPVRVGGILPDTKEKRQVAVGTVPPKLLTRHEASPERKALYPQGRAGSRAKSSLPQLPHTTILRVARPRAATDCEKHTHLSKLKEGTQRHVVYSEGETLRAVLQDLVSGEQIYPRQLQQALYCLECKSLPQFLTG
jgi:hypothetical protein